VLLCGCRGLIGPPLVHAFAHLRAPCLLSPGTRDSKILRSPTYHHAGYEWSLQLEITQTKVKAARRVLCHRGWQTASLAGVCVAKGADLPCCAQGRATGPVLEHLTSLVTCQHDELACHS